jgi:hypothetical protein
MSMVEYTFYLIPHLIDLNLLISNYLNNQSRARFRLFSLNSNHLSLLSTNLSKKSFVPIDFMIWISSINFFYHTKLFLFNYHSSKSPKIFFYSYSQNFEIIKLIDKCHSISYIFILIVHFCFSNSSRLHYSFYF